MAEIVLQVLKISLFVMGGSLAFAGAMALLVSGAHEEDADHDPSFAFFAALTGYDLVISARRFRRNFGRLRGPTVVLLVGLLLVAAGVLLVILF